jgi:hypothetical protein
MVAADVILDQVGPRSRRCPGSQPGRISGSPSSQRTGSAAGGRCRRESPAPARAAGGEDPQVPWHAARSSVVAPIPAGPPPQHQGARPRRRPRRRRTALPVPRRARA